MNYKLLKDKNYVISSNIIKNLDKDLSLNDFLLLIYFINNDNAAFDVEKISKDFNISFDEVMQSFNNLLSKELIELTQCKDLDGRIVESICADSIYKKIMDKEIKEEKKEEQDDIFALIEKEFDRKLSPTDYEIINAWLSIGTSIDLIKGALKEAAYNGIKTLKFVDMKIYEWNKKGLKTMSDVENYLKSKDNKPAIDLSEYDDIDWLNDDE